MNANGIDEDALWVTEKLNDRAYVEIKNKIIGGELAPGTRLVDSQLAERYGISRTPVRDAIRKLAEEGLVIASSAKKGYFVFEASLQDIVEIFEVRLIMDKAIITKLITEMLPSNYSHYNEIINKIEQQLEEGIQKGPKHFIHYDEAFHDSIIRLSNNSRIISIYSDNRTQTKSFRYQTSISAERIEKANKLHKELLTCIKNMDIEGALRSASEHVDLSRKDALADFNKASSANQEGNI